MGFVSGNHLLLFVIFLVLVLVIFGPGKLPDVGSGMGKAVREFRKATSEMRDSLADEGHRPTAVDGASASAATPADRGA